MASKTKTADEVVATMLARDGIRESASGGYIGEPGIRPGKPYIPEAGTDAGPSELRSGTESSILKCCLRMDGNQPTSVFFERCLRRNRIVRIRTRAPKSRITSDNYTFRLIEAGSLDGRTAYVIEAIPKREDKSLFRGRIWVDAEDYALARVEGEPAKNPSFWTRKVHFVQQYQKERITFGFQQ